MSLNHSNLNEWDTKKVIEKDILVWYVNDTKLQNNCTITKEL